MTAKIKRLVTALGLLLMVFTGGYSQVPVKKSNNKIIIEGKIYYIHIVKPGQTLYSITKAYEVTEKDIAIENPGVYSGLQVGQVLKIPVDVPKIRGEGDKPDTTNFIHHFLESGETIYSLSRKYNVPVAEIEKANPELDLRDLSIGQVVLIPKLQTVWSEEDFHLHEVRRRETLYRLSRRYGISEEEIIKYNPELRWGELKAGQIIRIPREDFLAEEKLNEIVDSERIDSLEMDKGEEYSEEQSLIDSLGLRELSVEDYPENLKDISRRQLKVAFLIPFNYRISEKEEEEENPESENEDQEVPEEKLPSSINFLEFFEGSLMALESLKAEGIDVHVKYFDTYRSPAKVREIINSPFFTDVDLIIGPFFAYNVEIVSEFSRKNRVPLVSPFYDGMDLTRTNPYLFQVNPSYKTEYSRAAEILSRQYDKNFIFIYQEDSLKYPEVEFFKTSLLRKLERFIHSENVVLKEISYVNPAKENLSADFSHALSSDKTNIVIIPEKDEAFVSTVITQLYFLLRDFDIEVFGLPHFHQFQNVDFQYYHDLQLSYLSPFYFDYKDEQVLSFLNHFSDHFKAEPSLTTREGCPYAFIGYDLTYYFIRYMSEWNRRFVTYLNSGEVDNVLPTFDFERPTGYGGFENQSLKLVSFTKDYEILARDTQIVDEPEIELPERIRNIWFNDEE